VGYTVFDTIPTSFLVPASLDDSEYINFRKRFNEIAKGFCVDERVPHKHCKGNVWLLKPANMNQGKGIEVKRNLKDIMMSISSKPYDSYWVLQKYVERPLLYKGRKFDIRVWVVVTEKYEVSVMS
jgi:hypothetical protein